MKKTYIKPKVTKVLLRNSHLLDSSYTPVGGFTDTFGAKRYDSSFYLYEEDEE